MLPSRQELKRRYNRKHGKLVQPKQGWDSLAVPLWLPYSMGIKRGFTDLGTYVNKPGDHGGLPDKRRRPAWAFDLGRENRFFFKGWNYLVARRFALFLVKHHRALDIEYVILGRKIWSRKNGWQPFNRDSSHDFHIHVSGHWPGR